MYSCIEWDRPLDKTAEVVLSCEIKVEHRQLTEDQKDKPERRRKRKQK